MVPIVYFAVFLRASLLALAVDCGALVLVKHSIRCGAQAAGSLLARDQESARRTRGRPAQGSQLGFAFRRLIVLSVLIRCLVHVIIVHRLWLLARWRCAGLVLVS